MHFKPIDQCLLHSALLQPQRLFIQLTPSVAYRQRIDAISLQNRRPATDFLIGGIILSG